jgi:sortase (surface protein transpeptidase)
MSSKKNLYVGIGITFWTLTAIFALLPSWPHLYYRLSPQVSSVLASTIASTVTESNPTIKEPQKNPENELPKPTPTETVSLPDVDPSLPTENGLIIDKIGVRGNIHEGEDWENILKKGIWRVPNFSTPLDDNKPVILAAHRWGYLEWSNSFRKLNSFYSLPQLKPGDTITIVWDQRPFEYKVYSTGTGTEITDYNAKLILYTCQLWNSPVRFFVYANRTN